MPSRLVNEHIMGWQGAMPSMHTKNAVHRVSEPTPPRASQKTGKAQPGSTLPYARASPPPCRNPHPHERERIALDRRAELLRASVGSASDSATSPSPPLVIPGRACAHASARTSPPPPARRPGSGEANTPVTSVASRRTARNLHAARHCLPPARVEGVHVDMPTPPHASPPPAPASRYLPHLPAEEGRYSRRSHVHHRRYTAQVEDASAVLPSAGEAVDGDEAVECEKISIPQTPRAAGEESVEVSFWVVTRGPRASRAAVKRVR
ncbi:hypothetical protein DFH08DRAFT_1081836 [Mycena albidolilacea]|uniref:Uncharacterized protein n=1 Tax=Mycena albidolilacea TaxID=1033008 RepID=A0AAD6ZW19_9AGAR|nr:hypothetical protein DFH08DRAFT_1081836 [Mycena albidolilacea]